MNANDLKEILKGNILRIDKINITDIASYGDDIPVYPKDVKIMLEKKLREEITSEELSKWAKFLCLRGEYGCPRNDEDEDFYEEMWDVIQALSIPEINGEINEACVKQYLSELKKYVSE